MKSFYTPFLLFLILLMASSCSHFSSEQGTRSMASVTPIIRRFLSAALKSDNRLTEMALEQSESMLLKDIKSRPSKYGMTEEASKKLTTLDDIQSERIVAEIISEAPKFFNYTTKMRKAGQLAIADEAGIASKIRVSSIDLSKITLKASEQSGLGREVSLRLKYLKNHLLEKKLASPSEANRIYKNLFKAAQDLSSQTRGKPVETALSKQIINYSIAISERTGKSFLGHGGCMKIKGRDVLENKAEIAYKTMTDVEAQKATSYDEIGEVLQKNHAEVTNRSRKEACLAIRALTVGRCKDVYYEKLAKDC